MTIFIGDFRAVHSGFSLSGHTNGYRCAFISMGACLAIGGFGSCWNCSGLPNLMLLECWMILGNFANEGECLMVVVVWFAFIGWCLVNKLKGETNLSFLSIVPEEMDLVIEWTLTRWGSDLILVRVFIGDWEGVHLLSAFIGNLLMFLLMMFGSLMFIGNTSEVSTVVPSADIPRYFGGKRGQWVVISGSSVSFRWIFRLLILRYSSNHEMLSENVDFDPIFVLMKELKLSEEGEQCAITVWTISLIITEAVPVALLSLQI